MAYPCAASPPSCRRVHALCRAQKYIGGLRAEGLKFGFVVGRFNELVTRLLLEGAAEAIERHGGEVADVRPCCLTLVVPGHGCAQSTGLIRSGVALKASAAHGTLACIQHWDLTGAAVQEVWVPGSFELPLIAKAMAASGKYDAVLAIGAVVRPPAVISCPSRHAARSVQGHINTESCCMVRP